LATKIPEINIHNGRKGLDDSFQRGIYTTLFGGSCASIYWGRFQDISIALNKISDLGDF